MAETRLKEILAFVNHKGGVGKTTTVQSLATGLRRYGKGYFGKGENGKERKPRILLIDLIRSRVFLPFANGVRQRIWGSLPCTMR